MDKKQNISALQQAGHELAMEAEISGCIRGREGWVWVFESAKSSGSCGLRPLISEKPVFLSADVVCTLCTGDLVVL